MRLHDKYTRTSRYTHTHIHLHDNDNDANDNNNNNDGDDSDEEGGDDDDGDNNNDDGDDINNNDNNDTTTTYFLVTFIFRKWVKVKKRELLTVLTFLFGHWKPMPDIFHFWYILNMPQCARLTCYKIGPLLQSLDISVILHSLVRTFLWCIYNIILLYRVLAGRVRKKEGGKGWLQLIVRFRPASYLSSYPGYFREPHWN